MGRYIRTLAHKAYVTQCTRVDDFLEVLGVNRVKFSRFRFIDHIEQRRKGITERVAQSTPMAYIKYTPHLFFEFLLIVEVGVLPSNWVTKSSARGVRRGRRRHSSAWRGSFPCGGTTWVDGLTAKMR
jgi:hypothetical protein